MNSSYWAVRLCARLDNGLSRAFRYHKWWRATFEIARRLVYSTEQQESTVMHLRVRQCLICLVQT